MLIKRQYSLITRWSQNVPQGPATCFFLAGQITISKVKSGNGDCPQIFAAVAISANIWCNVYKNICPPVFGRYCCKQAAQNVAINHLSIISLAMFWAIGCFEMSAIVMFILYWAYYPKCLTLSRSVVSSEVHGVCDAKSCSGSWKVVKSWGWVASVERVCGTRGLIESNISEPLSPDMLLAPCSAARNKQNLQCSAVQR